MPACGTQETLTLPGGHRETCQASVVGMWNGTGTSVRKVGWGLVVDAILMLKVRLHASHDFCLAAGKLRGVCLQGHRARPAARGLLTVN